MFCNKCFDMSVLRYELGHMDLCLPDVASHCGIAFHHHDAAEDARACAEILLHVAREG